MSMTRCLALAALMAAPAAATHAQAGAAPFDAARLVLGRDSFSVVVQGMNVGWQVGWLEKTPGGYTYNEKAQIGPSGSEAQVRFSDRFAMQSMTASGSSAGQSLLVSLEYADGRARGTASLPSPAGQQEQKVDVAVPGNVVDDAALRVLLTALPWAPGASWQVPILSSTAGQVIAVELTTGPKQQVTVPAGTFEVYAAQVGGVGQPLTMFVTAAAPHRVVKVEVAGMLQFVLEK
jgi:hypothetical protein